MALAERDPRVLRRLLMQVIEAGRLTAAGLTPWLPA
jgi:hypothetical protein